MKTHTMKFGKSGNMRTQLLFLAVYVSVSSLTAVATPAPQVQCPPLDRAGLSSLLGQLGEKELHLVFFSGWCSECSVHLKNLNNPKAILIGTFDKQPRIEKVVGKLKLANPCYTDAGIGKILDVKTVPSERRVSAETLK